MILKKLFCDYLINKEIRFISNTDFQINICYFYRNNMYSGNGGIKYCSNIVCNMKLENCIFYNCSCSGEGGGIYFWCNNYGTNVELRKICANYCFTDLGKTFQFCCIKVYNLINSLNLCSYLSINNCNKIFNGKISFYLYYGNITINNLNSTNNINKEYSGLYIEFPSIFYGIHNSIINNNISNYRNIMLQGNNNNKFLYSNFINNNSPLGYGVITIWDNGYFILDHCIFLNNYNILFYIYSGQLNVFNSKIYHLNEIYFGTFLTLNNSYILTNSFNLNHLNTYLCFINKIITQNNFKKIHLLIFLNIFIL